MDKVYQVFVSSTYADLEDERRKVSETLAKAGYIPAGMELFPATDQQQLDFIKRIIDRSDYYVVIVGGRYGSLADENVSFTEKEYEYALSRQIPILAFLHGKPEKIEVGKTDQDQVQARRLEAFRERLARGRIVDFWVGPDELCTKVVVSIAQAINLTPGIGWVRGDQAVDPKVLQDTELLRIENRDLKEKLARFDGEEVTFPSDLAGPEDIVDFTLEPSYGRAFDLLKARMSLQAIFCAIYDDLVRGEFEHVIQSNLATSWGRLNEVREIDEGGYSVVSVNLKQIRFHLEALGLIKAVGRTVTEKEPYHEDRDVDYIAWTVTDKGRRYMAHLFATFRKQT